ncbi:MAG TPA: RsiV family protein, partial [Candidatus Sulfotelmatobacter sp.]|nr:RsiV family protein [Candidatus Sulfotelmatobacter sp.]
SELTIADLGKRDGADKKWIKMGAGPDPAHFQKFVLSENEIIFFFDPYEVACYAAGPQTVSLPLTTLRDVWRKSAP